MMRGKGNLFYGSMPRRRPTYCEIRRDDDIAKPIADNRVVYRGSRRGTGDGRCTPTVRAVPAHERSQQRQVDAIRQQCTGTASGFVPPKQATFHPRVAAVVNVEADDHGGLPSGDVDKGTVLEDKTAAVAEQAPIACLLYTSDAADEL